MILGHADHFFKPTTGKKTLTQGISHLRSVRLANCSLQLINAKTLTLPRLEAPGVPRVPPVAGAGWCSSENNTLNMDDWGHLGTMTLESSEYVVLNDWMVKQQRHLGFLLKGHPTMSPWESEDHVVLVTRL